MSETKTLTAQKFFLYARKSTDVEDKQVLSIEAQLAELRAYAKQEGLQIIDELVEKQSAKVPGRPVFGELLRRIEQDEASGILAWHPDRLARNSIDGGQIVYLLDCGHLHNLKFPSFWFENTSQGKFMLSIAFGQSKYYVDNLSENTKRGLRQKVRRGEYPSHAPVGYINDVRDKSIHVDKRRAPIIKQAFELYAKGDQRLEDIANFLARNGIKTSGGKNLPKSRVSFLLNNPFYYGHFRYAGELYEGKHRPIILKELFDSAQAVMQRRSRPRKSKHNNPKAYCGLLSCAECHMAITAETQKGHVYYRCSKKSKTIACKQPYVREEELDKQISDLLKTVSLKSGWADELKAMLARDEQKSVQTSSAFVQEAKVKISSLQSKLQRLLDSYLDQDIDRDTFVNKKAELMSQKKSLEEQIIRLEQKQTDWLEPFKEWIEEADDLCQIAKSDDMLAKKFMSRKIFGSNLRISDRHARHLAADGAAAPLEKHWTALRAARQNFGKIENSILMALASGHVANR